jgi:hypothetical protein
MMDDMHLRLYKKLLYNSTILWAGCSVLYCYFVSVNFGRHDVSLPHSYTNRVSRNLGCDFFTEEIKPKAGCAVYAVLYVENPKNKLICCDIDIRCNSICSTFWPSSLHYISWQCSYTFYSTLVTLFLEVSQVPPVNLRLQPPYFNTLTVLYISLLSFHFLLQPSFPFTLVFVHKSFPIFWTHCNSLDPRFCCKTKIFIRQRSGLHIGCFVLSLSKTDYLEMVCLYGSPDVLAGMMTGHTHKYQPCYFLYSWIQRFRFTPRNCCLLEQQHLSLWLWVVLLLRYRISWACRFRLKVWQL